jgi:hypothetical protein
MNPDAPPPAEPADAPPPVPGAAAPDPPVAPINIPLAPRRSFDWARVGRSVVYVLSTPGWLLSFTKLRWALLLVATYFVTCETLSRINTWATAATERELADHLHWLNTKEGVKPAPVYHTAEKQYLVPPKTDGKKDAAGGVVLDPSRVGARKADDLPDKLKSADGAEWATNPERSAEFAALFFERKFEDPFDKFFATHLGVPLQPLLREKYLRSGVGYADWIQDESDDKKREALLRHFSNVYGECMGLFPCRVIRWMNGWVQVLAVAAFWLSLMIVAYQYWADVVWERWRARSFFPFTRRTADGRRLAWTAPAAGGGLLTRDRVETERTAVHDPALGRDPGVAVQMLREVYDGYVLGELSGENVRDRAAASDALEHVTERRLRRIESGMASLVYLGWSLPSLGFVGTVLGLGTALLTAGDMVTPVSELQRDAIQTVSIYLGRAFDKTFVALLLSLILMAFIYALRHAQESVVLGFQERIARGVVPRLRN